MGFPKIDMYEGIIMKKIMFRMDLIDLGGVSGLTDSLIKELLPHSYGNPCVSTQVERRPESSCC